MSEEKTLIETIEENKIILKAEYQRGFANGGQDMNEKWLITRQEIIDKFMKSIDILISKSENINRNDVNRTMVDCYWIIKLKKEYQEKLK